MSVKSSALSQLTKHVVDLIKHIKEQSTTAGSNAYTIPIIHKDICGLHKRRTMEMGNKLEATLVVVQELTRMVERYLQSSRPELPKQRTNIDTESTSEARYVYHS